MCSLIFLEFYTENILNKINEAKETKSLEEKNNSIVQSLIILHAVSINCEKDWLYFELN